MRGLWDAALFLLVLSCAATAYGRVLHAPYCTPLNAASKCANYGPAEVNVCKGHFCCLAEAAASAGCLKCGIDGTCNKCGPDYLPATRDNNWTCKLDKSKLGPSMKAGDRSAMHGHVHDPPCTTVAGPDVGSACVFPFTYRGETFTACTDAGNRDVRWCATEVGANHAFIAKRWGDCSEGCPAGHDHHAPPGPPGPPGPPAAAAHGGGSDESPIAARRSSVWFWLFEHPGDAVLALVGVACLAAVAKAACKAYRPGSSAKLHYKD